MSTLNIAVPGSPLEPVLSSPPDPNIVLGSTMVPSPLVASTHPSDYFNYDLAPASSATAGGNVVDPNTKTPRMAARAPPGLSGEDELTELTDLPTFSSPGRRGRHYGSIHQELGTAAGDNTDATPKAGAAGVIRFNVGIAPATGAGHTQSADPTPMRYGQYSSPVINSPLRGVHVPGDDYTPWKDIPSPHMPSFALEHQPTPTQSPARAGGKRGLEGLGQSPLRTAKRSRYASMSSAPVSVPPSPLRPRSREVSTSSLMTNAPLERSASLAAPAAPMFGTNRIVSNVSMISTTSTELMSPTLHPQYSPYHPGLMSFPVPGSQEMVNNRSSNDSLNPTISPSQLMTGSVPSFASLTAEPIFSSSPDIMNADGQLQGQLMSAQPSQQGSPIVSTAPNSHMHTFPTQADRGMTLSTIHEQGSDIITPMTIQNASFTPAMGYSIGMPSHPQLPSNPAYASYQSFSEAGEATQDPMNVSAWSQNTYDSNQRLEHHGVNATQWWNNGGLTPNPNLGQPSMAQQGVHMPAYSRATSASYVYNQARPGAPGYHPHYPHAAPGMMPRSVSAPFVPTMPSSSLPSGSTTGVNGLFVLPTQTPIPGPASAPMNGSSSLPMHEPIAPQYPSGAWHPHARDVSGTGSNYEYEPQYSGLQSAPASIVSSPITPSRKRHPTVGNRLRPGPKPKNTPKKGKGTLVASPPSSTAFNSSTIAGQSSPHIPSSAMTSPDIPYASHPSGLRVAVGSSSSSRRLELGGPLTAPPSTSSFAHNLSVPPSRQASQLSPSLSTSSMPPPAYHPLMPADPAMGHPHASGPDTNAIAGPSRSQPALRMDPPAKASTPEGIHNPALPKDFIDKLYQTVLEYGPNGAPLKRFKCLIEGCERVFPRKSAICSHIQTHLDDKPHGCDVPGCGATFVRQHDLKRHMKIHTGEKGHNCVCGKPFARGDALMRHRQRNICDGGIDTAPGPSAAQEHDED